MDSELKEYICKLENRILQLENRVYVLEQSQSHVQSTCLLRTSQFLLHPSISLETMSSNQVKLVRIEAGAAAFSLVLLDSFSISFSKDDNKPNILYIGLIEQCKCDMLKLQESYCNVYQEIESFNKYLTPNQCEILINTNGKVMRSGDWHNDEKLLFFREYNAFQVDLKDLQSTSILSFNFKEETINYDVPLNSYYIVIGIYGMGSLTINL